MNPSSFPEIRIVEASAGSGKTYALAKRFVQLILNPSEKHSKIPLKNILAITFTNKATIEMKERILEFLKKIAFKSFRNKDEETDILCALALSEKAASERAFFVMDYIVANYNFFQVQTIDSFVKAIISGCAFKLNLSPGFEIQREHSDYLLSSLDELIEKAQEDDAVSGIFKNFLKHYLLIENRAAWFPKNNILFLIQGLYSISNVHGASLIKTNRNDNIFVLKEKVVDSIKEISEKLPKGTKKNFEKKVLSLASQEYKDFLIDDLSKYFQYDTFPVNKGHSVPDNISGLWDEVRVNIKNLCEYEAYSFFNCYIDIYNNVMAGFKELAADDGVLFLSELNRQAHTLFAGSMVGVPELYYRLATRFKHFLIDEFQDTSELQWKNLAPMAEEALSTGGSLFYVGDKKQAIYRFRGGASELFDKVPDSFADYKKNYERLGKNFRSHAEIVTFNNGIFSEDNLDRFLNEVQREKGEELFASKDMNDIIEAFVDSSQVHRKENNQGYVCVSKIDAKNIEERDSIMKGMISEAAAELKTRFEYKDIAFLLRDNKDVETITGWLLEAGIPVASDRTLNVRENSLIKEIVSFLKFLNSPIDELSFVSFICGDMFSCAAGIEKQEIRDFVFRLNTRNAGRKNTYFYRIFREAYPKLWDKYFEPFIASAGFVPLYELLVSILGTFKVIENFSLNQAFIMCFLELVKNCEDENTGAASFIEYFESASDDELYVTVSGANAINVLTIHKSKGLEFPVVVMPFFEMSVSVTSRSKSGMHEVKNDENSMSLVRLRKQYNGYSEKLKALYDDNYKKSFIDELNTAYVALTRAKCELYLFIPEKASGSNNLARIFIPQEAGEHGTKQRYEITKDEKGEQMYDIPAQDFRDWLSLLKDEFSITAPIANRGQRMKGEYLHSVLSFVGNLKDADKNKVLERAVSSARQIYPNVPDARKLEKTISELINKKSLKQFFEPEKAEVYQEKEVVDNAGHTIRIDRLIVKDDVVMVVDYKSSKLEPGVYAAQMQHYMGVIGGIYPKRTVKGYIIYLDDKSFEEM